MKAMISAMTVAMAVVGGSAAFAAEPTATNEATVTSESTATTTDTTADPAHHESVGTGAEAYCYWETYCNVYGYCWTNWVCF